MTTGLISHAYVMKLHKNPKGRGSESFQFGEHVEVLVLPKPKFSSSLLKRTMLKRLVWIGRDYEFYLGSWSPAEKKDSCPSANSEVSAWRRDF